VFAAELGSATATRFSVVSLKTAAGRRFSVTVTARDSVGHTATNYTGTVHFRSTDKNATLPANYTFTSADAGVHTFTVTLRTPGSQTITATDTNNSAFTSTTDPITVVVPPAVTSLSPSSAVKGGSSFTLTVAGRGFVNGSTVDWNGSSRATTFVSATKLTAAIPPSDIQKEGADEVTVGNGGIPSDAQIFYVTLQGTTVTGSNSATSPDSSGTASTSVGSGPGSVAASASGGGTVAVAKYSSNPGSTTNFNAPGGFFDVHLSSGNSFGSATIVDCNVGNGNTVYWFNGAAWVAASNQTYNATTHCVTITVTSNSTPSLSQLGGSIFAASRATAARVTAFRVSKQGSRLTFHWTVVVKPHRVFGFNLFAGAHRLNPKIIPVHAKKRYTYTTHWAGKGPFFLRVLLSNGQIVTVRA
jgi:hypothetical protein